MNSNSQYLKSGLLGFITLLSITPSLSLAQSSPSKEEVRASLSKATEFMTTIVADHGGYAWVSSPDGQYSHGEGVAGNDRVWVQPPGTPAVGLAFLAAYDATRDSIHLNAAKKVGEVLMEGQLRSGGWGYSITFDPAERQKIPYRVGPGGSAESIPQTPEPGGWDVWKQGKYKTNKTLIDDDTTPCAIRFLCKLDKTLKFQDKRVHEAVDYALRSALAAQYPCGAWGHNYDCFPLTPIRETHYPIRKASYPESWDKKWPKSYQACYALNDRITLNMIETMLAAAETYDDDRFRKSAIRGGEFLLLSQMPEPQPAWAQQYDRHMQPVWERKFEPPAITGGESQDAIGTLMVLYRATGDKRFLQPIPRAIEYLKTCMRSDGRLARYYELKTNRPIYFTTDYEFTYDDRSIPDHYSFIVDSKIDKLQREFSKLTTDVERPKTVTGDPRKAASVIKSQTKAGAWLEPGFVRNLEGKKVVPEKGVVSSKTFIDNVDVLCRMLNDRKFFRSEVKD